MKAGLVAALGVGVALGMTPDTVYGGDLSAERATGETSAGTEVSERAEDSSSRPVNERLGVGVGSGREPTSARRSVGDLTILPGQRVGEVTREVSEGRLREAYGDENVAPIAISLGEGETAPGTAVFPGTDRELQIVWVDQRSKHNPQRVLVIGKDWRTPSGVGIGSTLKELENLNAKPFALAGFGWDYAGTVTNWRGGKLADELDSTGGRTFVRLRPLAGADVSGAIGDSTYLSSEPAMQRINPLVYALVVEFTHQRTAQDQLATDLVGRWKSDAAHAQLMFELRSDGTILLQLNRPGQMGRAAGRWAVDGSHFNGQVLASDVPEFPVGYSWSDEIIVASDEELVLRNQSGRLEEYVAAP